MTDLVSLEATTVMAATPVAGKTMPLARLHEKATTATVRRLEAALAGTIAMAPPLEVVLAEADCRLDVETTMDPLLPGTVAMAPLDAGTMIAMVLDVTPATHTALDATPATDLALVATPAIRTALDVVQTIPTAPARPEVTTAARVETEMTISPRAD